MKFKYMVRGLGLGIIITAVAMGAYSRKAVADARVSVLKEYGIGEDNELAMETQSESTETESATATTEPVIVRDEDIEAEISSVLDAAKESEQAVAGTAATEAQPETAGTEAAQTAGDADEPEQPADAAVPEGEIYKFTVEKGDDSRTISRRLQTAKIIENAAEFDAYLTQHGYDKKISTGTKNISRNDKWQDIAEKLINK